MQEVERIEFSQNWNNKLLCFCFTSIRPQSKKYDVGEVFDIRIKERHFCYAKVFDYKNLNLTQIVYFNYHLLDTGLNEKDFFELMEKFYSKKTWWNGMNTEMQVVFFEKVAQLDMFENNKFLT